MASSDHDHDDIPPPSSSSSLSTTRSPISVPNQDHKPTVPSGLRQTHIPSTSPEARRTLEGQEVERSNTEDQTESTSAEILASGITEEPSQIQPTARTSLLGSNRKSNEETESNPADSLRPRWYGSFGTSDSLPFGWGGRWRAGSVDTTYDGQSGSREYAEEYLGSAITDGLLGKPGNRSTTHRLVKDHGLKHERLMYLSLPLIAGWTC